MSRLLVTHGHHFGVCYELLERTTLGRSSGCTIQLLDEKVSRRHSSVVRKGDTYTLQDEGSSNGTGLNGRLLLEPAELTPGDEVAVGNNLMLFDPDLEILRDLEGAGSVILAARGGAAVPPPAPISSESPSLQPFRFDALLNGVAEMLSGPRGVGRPAALVEAVTRGMGADNGALLLAPTGGEPMKAVATYPHRGRVTIAREAVHKVLESKTPLLSTEGTVELTVRAGRSLIEAHLGTSIAVPILHGGRIRGVFYADSARRDAFSELPLTSVQSVLTVTFTRMLAGPPQALRPPRATPSHVEPASQSPAMQAVVQQARTWAESTAPLLLIGEPGSGRAFLGSYLHSISPRCEGPFVQVHCGALPEATAESALFGHERGAISGADERHVGLLETADGGTLLLDDIAELGPQLQVRLLRALQEGRFYRVGGTRPVRVDARIVAGTHRDLLGAVRDGLFRDDLFETLSVLRLDVPPLRRRLADIDPLIKQFVADFNRTNGTRLKGFTPESVGLMETHDWPGNVRELREAVNRLIVLTRGKFVEAKDVEEELAAHPSSASYAVDDDVLKRLWEREKRWLSAALDRCRGNKARASHMLGMEPSDLDRLVALHSVDEFGR